MGILDYGSGLYDDLFDRPDPETRVVDPLAKQKTQGADRLLEIMNKPLPRERVAGMGISEQFVQDELLRYLQAGLPKELGSVSDYYSKLLSQPIDPASSPEFRAGLSTIQSERDLAVARSERGIQMQGMGTSTPQGRAVGREIAQGDVRSKALLENFIREERSRKDSAAAALLQSIQQRELMQQGRFAAGYQFDRPRQLEQANLSNLYAQKMGEFTTIPDIISRLFGADVDYTLTQDQSLFDQLAPMATSLGTAAIMASDKRVKENIDDLGYASRKVKKIKAKVYNYKGTDPENRRVGFLAQDIEKVLPEAVKEIHGIKHVDYAAVIALATDAVNELIRDVDKLKRRKVA